MSLLQTMKENRKQMEPFYRLRNEALQRDIFCG